MRIQASDLRPTDLETEPKHGPRAAAAAAAPPGEPAVIVTPELTKASSVRAKSDADTEARIATLKAQIDGGTYKVDLDRLAEKMADEEIARAVKP